MARAKHVISVRHCVARAAAAVDRPDSPGFWAFWRDSQGGQGLSNSVQVAVERLRLCDQNE